MILTHQGRTDFLLELAERGPIIPVIVLDRVEDAVPMARALLEGGVSVMEVTLRTEAAAEAISVIAAQVPEVVVGAGTLRQPQDAQIARQAGARFVVSPGYTGELAAACDAVGLPLLPGVCTAGDLMRAFSDGFTFFKFFPAEPSGGVATLKALSAPFPEASFCPTGGISATNAADYLAQPFVPLCGGSWLTPRSAVEEGRWEQITELAAQAGTLRPT